MNAKAAAIPCELEEFDDMINAYLNLENLVPDSCRETYRQIGEFLNA
jgi:acetyl esterase/lipase